MRNRLVIVFTVVIALLAVGGNAIAAPGGGSGKKPSNPEPIVDPLPISCTATTSPASQTSGCGQSFTLDAPARVDVQQTAAPDFTGRLTTYVDDSPVAAAMYAAGELIDGTASISMELSAALHTMTVKVMQATVPDPTKVVRFGQPTWACVPSARAPIWCVPVPTGTPWVYTDTSWRVVPAGSGTFSAAITRAA